MTFIIEQHMPIFKRQVSSTADHKEPPMINNYRWLSPHFLRVVILLYCFTKPKHHFFFFSFSSSWRASQQRQNCIAVLFRVPPHAALVLPANIKNPFLSVLLLYCPCWHEGYVYAHSARHNSVTSVKTTRLTKTLRMCSCGCGRFYRWHSSAHRLPFNSIQLLV